MEPTFLTLDEILTIHRDQIARYGGSEGVRDWGMLLSVARGETPKSAVAEFLRANTEPA